MLQGQTRLCPRAAQLVPLAPAGAEASEGSSLAIATLVGRYIERREARQPPCTHDLFAVAGEFGDTAVDALRTVLACYEAMRATEDHAR